MKPTFGIIILLSALTIAGCATPRADYEKAEHINSVEAYRAFLQKYPYSQYTEDAKSKIAKLEETERRKNQIKENWGKLRKGMSVEEVDTLIGPLNATAMRRIKNLAGNKNASSSAGNVPKAGGGFPYGGHYFTLQFDAAGKLSEWSLK